MLKKITNFFTSGTLALQSEFKKLSFFHQILIIISLGTLLNILLISPNNASHDEQATMLFFAYPWKEMIKLVSIEDGHPPFSHIFYRLWQLGGDHHNIIPLRFATIFILLLTSLLGVFPVRRLFGNTISLWFTTFVFVLPSSFYLSSNIRMYPLATFLVLGAFIHSISIAHKPAKLDWFFLIIYSIISLYTHYYCGIILAIIWGGLLIDLLRQKKYQQIKLLFLYGIITSLLYIPGILIFLEQYNNMKTTWFPKQIHTETAIAGAFFNFKNINTICSYLFLFFGFLCWSLIGQFLTESRSNLNKLTTKRAVIVFWGLFISATLISIFIRPTIFARLIIIPFGILYIALAITITYYKKLQKLFLTFLIPTFLVCLTEYYTAAQDTGYTDFQQQVKKSLPKDSLILYNNT